MARTHRYAVLAKSEQWEENQEFEVAGDGLREEEAIEQLHKLIPDHAEIVKPLRGHFGRDPDLSRSSDAVDGTEEGSERDETVAGTDPERDDVEFEEWHNWNEDDWLSLDYTDREADVLAGRADDHLDDIESVETSATVEEAVERRREEVNS